jgi:CBS domain-containing protein
VHDYFMRHRFHSFPVLADGQVVGLVTLHEVKKVPREQWDHVIVGQIMNSAVRALSVGPHDSAMVAWMRMSAAGVRRAVVVEDGRLVGILSETDLVRFLNIVSDLDSGRE